MTPSCYLWFLLTGVLIHSGIALVEELNCKDLKNELQNCQNENILSGPLKARILDECMTKRKLYDEQCAQNDLVNAEPFCTDCSDCYYKIKTCVSQTKDESSCNPDDPNSCMSKINRYTCNPASIQEQKKIFFAKCKGYKCSALYIDITHCLETSTIVESCDNYVNESCINMIKSFIYDCQGEPNEDVVRDLFTTLQWKCNDLECDERFTQFKECVENAQEAAACNDFGKNSCIKMIRPYKNDCNEHSRQTEHIEQATYLKSECESSQECIDRIVKIKHCVKATTGVKLCDNKIVQLCTDMMESFSYDCMGSSKQAYVDTLKTAFQSNCKDNAVFKQ